MRERIKVLIVDDDKRMAKTLCDILKVKGYEAIEANSGEEAIEKVSLDAPDCILMDIRMGGLSGIETLKAIRQITPALPAILLMSAYATEEQISEAKAVGACAVINKPLDIKAVLTFLNILGKEISILVAGDDPEFCGMLQDVLQSKGHKVEIEMNPDNIIGAMEQEYKLVVLLDLKSGNTDVLKTIRTKYPTKPVILITGYEKEPALIDKARPTEVYVCLYKPLEIDVLIEQIEAIDRKKLQALLEKK
jgi:two-component system, NtrC family, response regulator HydG